MTKYNKSAAKRKQAIDEIQVTSERLTGRAGMALFVRYLNSLALLPHLDRLFGSIRKNGKGLSVMEVFKQAICFLLDGTSRHLTYFDHLKQEEGYAGTIETDEKDMASSHTIKRVFQGFVWVRIFLFRKVLQSLFLWRLNKTKPPVVELGIDTMVMDNDDAGKRHGVKPTYKKKKGFQPLQMNWGRYFVDAVFRGGDKHSNHGNTVEKMIVHMVKKIREHYRHNVPIIIRIDGGFFDQKIFAACEELGVGYICGGKLYVDIVTLAKDTPSESWKQLHNDKRRDGSAWEYMEFGDRRGTWKKFRRAIYCRLLNNGPQLYLPGARPDTIIYTNIGAGGGIDELLKEANATHYLATEAIIANYHERGTDELVNRAFKDFGHEQLPFKKFNPNAAWYYTMLLAFFLYEAFKEDVCSPVLQVSSYASTVRRKLIDIAGKIVTHSGKIILKVTQTTWDRLRIKELWEKSGTPPIFVWP